MGENLSKLVRRILTGSIELPSSHSLPHTKRNSVVVSLDKDGKLEIPVSQHKGRFPLIAEITRRQFFQWKFGAKTMAAIII